MREAIENIQGRLMTLGQLYTLFDKAMERFSLACGENCPHCCTCNVTMTGLEAAFIFFHLAPDELRAMKERLESGFPEKRFQMKMTLNSFARACIQGDPVLEEENNPLWGSCPLLEGDQCTIYRARPLGCRVMGSGIKCSDQGFAQMDPLALTISNIMAQHIEQLDMSGFSANFSDVLAAYLRLWEPDGDPGNVPLYLSLDNPDISDRKEIFLRNQSIPALMVPPEHREDAAPLLKEIAALGRSET